MSDYVAKQGTTALGIIGTALGGLNAAGGMLGLGAAANGYGYNNNQHYGWGPHFVTKDMLDMAMIMAAKDSEIALLKSEQNTEIKIADVYERLAKKINDNQREQEHINREQAVYNGVNNASVGVLRSQVDQLMDLTKRVVPAHNVCPRPMPRYNRWEIPIDEATPAVNA